MTRRIRSVFSLACLLVGLRAASQTNPLPPPNHPVAFGYNLADSAQYGDFYDEVACYTTLHMPLYGSGTPEEQQAYRASARRAWQDGKRIYVSLRMLPSGVFDADAERPSIQGQLDALMPYWSSVAYIELATDPTWGPAPDFGGPNPDLTEHIAAGTIDQRANFVRDLVAESGLPERPIGLVLGRDATTVTPWPDSANRYTYSSLDWVGGTAFLYSSDFTSSCEAIDALTTRVNRFKQRMAPKALILTMQGTVPFGGISNVQALRDLQRAYYPIVANDARVHALTVHSYAGPRGTRQNPDLIPFHQQMGDRFLGGLPAGCANTNPALNACTEPPPPPGGTYAPQNLRVTSAEGSTVNLAWENVGTPATKFWVYGSPDGVNFSIKGERPAGSTTASPVVGLPGLPDVGLMRCFYVKALFGDGNPKDSAVVCTTVFRDPPSTAPVPQGASGCQSALRPRLTWASIPTATRYYAVVTRTVDGVPVDWDDAIDDTSYVPKVDLQAGIRYQWHVRGCNNQGCGTSAALWSSWTYIMPFCTARADFGTDGRSDVVFRSALTGDHSVWQMSGSSRLGSSLFSPAKPASGNWSLVAANDFSGDGKPDLLWRNGDSGTFSLWTMNGVVRTSGLTFPGLPDVGNRVVGTGDFNVDGKPDVVWHHPLTGALSVSWTDGTKITGTTDMVPGFLPTTSAVAAVGDINGDRWPDLLVRNLTTGAMEAWVYQGYWRAGVAPITAASIPDLSWKVISLEDMDRNGSVDIVWQNATSNRLVVWYMDGTGFAQASGSFFVPDGSTEADLKAVGPR